MLEPWDIFDDYIKTQIRPFLNKKYPTFHLMGSDGLIFPIYSKLDAYKTMLYSKMYNVEWKIITLENFIKLADKFHWDDVRNDRFMIPTTEDDTNYVAHVYLGELDQIKKFEHERNVSLSEILNIEKIEIEFFVLFDKVRAKELFFAAEKKQTSEENKKILKEFINVFLKDNETYGWIENDLQFWCTRSGYEKQKLPSSINLYELNNIQSKYMHFVLKNDYDVTKETLPEFAKYVNRPLELVENNIDIKKFRKVKTFIDNLWIDRDSLNI